MTQSYQDLQERIAALELAVKAHEGLGTTSMRSVRTGEILATAKAFETYLRGPGVTITNHPADDVTGPGTDG